MNDGRVRVGYWLVKTEPGEYSYADLVREGTTVWSGITNNQALLNVRRMKRGESVFVYHTGSEKAIVGIARTASAPYADPRSKDAKRAVIDIVPERPLKRAVTLAELRTEPSLSSFDLIRNSRLSVMAVSAPVWKLILTKSEA